MDKKENITNLEDLDRVDMVCDITDEENNFEKTKREDTATDVYYKTECKLPGSKVAIPTFDSVLEAKNWADKENRR